MLADLGALQRVREVELLAPQGQALSLAGLRLELCQDGGEYRPGQVKALWPSQLYWSGLVPMAAAPGPVRLELDCDPTRCLRLSRWGPPLPPGLTLRISVARN